MRVHSLIIFILLQMWCYARYGVATISRMLKNLGLFCKRALQKRPVFCKETCIFKHPTHRSHPIDERGIWPSTYNLMTSLTWWHRADDTRLHAGRTELEAWLACIKLKGSSEAHICRTSSGGWWLLWHPTHSNYARLQCQRKGGRQPDNRPLYLWSCMFFGIRTRDEHLARRAHVAIRATATSTKGCQAKSRAAQRGDGGTPRPLQTLTIMLGRLEKFNDTKYMAPSSAHRDGRPFGISLESLAVQGVCLEMRKWDRFVLSCKSNSRRIQNRTNVMKINNLMIEYHFFSYINKAFVRDLKVTVWGGQKIIRGKAPLGNVHCQYVIFCGSLSNLCFLWFT